MIKCTQVKWDSYYDIYLITLESELLRSASTKCTSKATKESDVSKIDSALNIPVPDNKTQFTRHPATIVYPPLSITSSSSSTKSIAPLSPISQSATSESKTSFSTESEGAFYHFCIRISNCWEKDLQTVFIHRFS